MSTRSVTSVTGARYTLRRFATIDEYRECVALQEQVWGEGFSERVSVAILKVSQRIGGIAAGAWDAADDLVGFVFGMTGVEEGRLVHWSDMLAVRPGLRDAGLGTLLKAYQRDEMSAIGVERIYWTFDPLQSRNAHLNFNKLGIVVREYARDMYGQTDSPLHAGIGTDRFVASWEIRTDRVERRLGGDASPELDPRSAEPVLSVKDQENGWPEPGGRDLNAAPPVLSVPIPGNIDALKADSPTLALAWREATREVLVHYLDHGYYVAEFERGPVTAKGVGVCRYLLARR